jgi:ankyrin repeat protein
LKKAYLTPTHLVSVADTCASLDCIGSVLQNHKDELKKWLSRMPGQQRSELVSELCRGTYPHLARAVAPYFADSSTVDSEAQFVKIYVHYGFTDIMKKRVQKLDDALNRFKTPCYKPTSSHRLSKNDNANAWLWLIKGDGDLTEKIWNVIKELRLTAYGGYHQFFVGLSLSGTKISGNFVSSSVVKEIISNCKKDISVLKYLVECGVDIVSLCPAILHYAHDLDTAKYFVQCGATVCVNEDGQTPLHHRNETEIPVIDFLIEIGADVNAVNSAGETALHCTEYTDVVRCLIAHKADVNARDNDGKTSLHTSILHEMSQVLIAHRADIHARDNYGKTPLHSVYSDDIVQLLIDHKADVRALDNTGRTPLHYRKSRDAIKTLMKNGVDIETVDEEGMTPLMTVIRACGTPLLQCGANPRAVDLKGRTAMHHITCMPDGIIVAMVKKKADPNIRDNDGKTPMDLARGCWNVATELRKVGAKKTSN